MDHATRSLDIIFNSGRFVKIPDVEIFDEHNAYDAKGNKRVVDKAKLESICKSCNERFEKTSDLSPGGPGHTISGAPETDQPPVWSYFHNYRVTKIGPEGKKRLGIVADEWIEKQVYMKTGPGGRFEKVDHTEALNQFPRRSVEYWSGPDENFFDWIAHLRKTPQLDLGLMLFDKASNATVPYRDGQIYADAKKARRYAAQTRWIPGRGEKLYYSMEQPMIPNDPTAAPDAAQDSEFEGKCDKYMKSRYPRFDEMHSTYDKEHPPVDPTDPNADPDGDGNPNATDPTPEGNPPQEPPMSDDSIDPKKFAKGDAQTLAIKYQRLERENKQIKARLDAADKARTDDAEKFSRADAAAIVKGLQLEGYELDRQAEEDAIANLPIGEKRDAYAEKVRKYYRQDDIGTGPPARLMIDIPNRGKPAGAEPSEAEHQAAIQYMRTSKTSDYDAALQFVRKK